MDTNNQKPPSHALVPDLENGILQMTRLFAAIHAGYSKHIDEIQSEEFRHILELSHFGVLLGDYVHEHHLK